VADDEFIAAMHVYKETSGRMFPTWSEVLEVLTGLGYAKPDALIKAATDAMPPQARDDIEPLRRAHKLPAIRRDPPGVPRASHTGR
jgi:hypothetical protein